MKKAIILAGGFGTRLKSVVGDTPKPMALIAGKPFLEHQIHSLRQQGVEEVVLALHYEADQIKSYFGNGRRWGINITYSEEEIPLGTGGAVKNAERYIKDSFFVLNGDSYSKLDLGKFLNFHQKEKNLATMSLTFVNEPGHYGNVVLRKNKVSHFSEKTSEGEGLINSGVYLFEPQVLEMIPSGKKVSLETEIFPTIAKQGKLGGFPYEGYFIDIGRPETYSQFKRDLLEKLVLTPESDVREAMQRITENGVDLILVNDENGKLQGVLNDKLIKRYILSGGNVGDNITCASIKNPLVVKDDLSEDEISRILIEGTNRLPVVNLEGKVIDVRFRNEEVRRQIYPTLSGKAPLRISFAGGGSDKQDFFEEHGGVVISSTINKYCHATIVKRADSKIVVSSDFEEEKVFDVSKTLDYNGEHNLVKSIATIMKPDFGFELYTHNDVPPGRGLGSSATFSVLVAKLIGQIQGIEYDDHALAKIAYDAERQELGIGGGWQDQYAAVTGGFNFMEFGKDKSIIYPLRLKKETTNELENRLTLCYVGKEHDSGAVHANQAKTYHEKKEEVLTQLEKIKRIALETKDALLSSELDRAGELLHESWLHKKEIAGAISEPRIDRLYELGRVNGAVGGKLLGAGGGGYILFYHSPKKRNELSRALKTAGGEIMSFGFDFEGAQTWKGYSKS